MTLQVPQPVQYHLNKISIPYNVFIPMVEDIELIAEGNNGDLIAESSEVVVEGDFVGFLGAETV